MKKNKFGFSLIELLVVITITVLLISIGMVSYTKAGQMSRNGKRKQDLETIRQALVLYRVDMGSYPETNVFDDMMDDLKDEGYLNIDGIKDPKDDPPFEYTYDGTPDSGKTFTVCATLEPDDGSPATCLVNP